MDLHINQNLEEITVKETTIGDDKTITKKRKSTDSSYKEGIGTARRNNESEAKVNVLSTPSSMSNEDVEVKVLRQSGDLANVGVPNTDPKLKEMVKFK